MERNALNRASRTAARVAACSLVALSVGACSSTWTWLDSLWPFDHDEEHPTAERYAELSGTQAALMRIADATAAAGDVATAAEFYHRAVLSDPSQALPYARLGDALHRLGAYEQAALAYRRAGDIDPSAARTHYGLGKALLSLGRNADAVVALRTAVELEGTSRHFNALGVAMDLSGDRAGAQAVYRKGLAELPGDLTLMNNLGLSLALDGKAREGVAVLSEVAARPESNARHRQNLALALGLAGRLDEAADVNRRDLHEGAVQSNVAFYKWLRTQPAETVALALNLAVPSKGSEQGATAELPADPATAIQEIELN